MRKRPPPECENRPESASETLVGEEAKPGGIQSLHAKLARYATARRRARSMAAFLRTTAGAEDSDGTPEPPAGGGESFERQHACDCADRLECCGEWLHFRHYLDSDELRLVAAQFCQLSKLCPLCAIRRGARNLGAYLERFRLVMAEQPALIAYMVTLTVKNGDDLVERMGHLRQGVKRLTDRRRQALSGNGRGRTEFRKVAGAVGSYEVTNRGNGWHPHVHMIVLATEQLDQAALVAEWRRSTGDSFIVDVRQLGGSEEETTEAFCEVFKYAMKFQDLQLADNWRAHLQLRGKRLLVSLGCFYGVPEPEVLTDTPLEDEPYVDLFFRYLAGAGAYSFDRRGDVDPSLPSSDLARLDPRAKRQVVKRLRSHEEVATLAGEVAARLDQVEHGPACRGGSVCGAPTPAAAAGSDRQ